MEATIAGTEGRVAEPLPALVNAMLAVEGGRTRLEIRQSHLKLNGIQEHPQGLVAHQMLQETEEKLDDIITQYLEPHPAWHWFIRVKGIGNRNIPKVVGLIDIRRAPTVSSLWKYAGMHVVPNTITPEEQLAGLQSVASSESEKRIIELLKKALAGAGRKVEKKLLAQTEAEAELLDPEITREAADAANAKLREAKEEYVDARRQQEDLTRRIADITERIRNIREHVLAGSFEEIQSGKAPRPVKGKKLDYNKELRTMCWVVGDGLLKAGGKYYEVYARERERLIQRSTNRGLLILKAEELPTDESGKKYEPYGVISDGHLFRMAMRKMIKLFLCHLWLVWRQAEGLDIREPYVQAMLGHTHIIDPWTMVEKPEPKRKHSVN